MRIQRLPSRLLALVAALGIGATALWATRQESPPAQAADRAGDMAAMADRLIAALEATPGCLGTDAAEMRSGKFVIFGFFENKAAATEWYNHPMHVGMRRASGITPPAGYEPMADVPDDTPVLALASLAFDGPPAVEGAAIPFSAISIELYAPLDGGLRINGGFAPEAFVPRQRDAVTRPADEHD